MCDAIATLAKKRRATKPTTTCAKRDETKKTRRSRNFFWRSRLASFVFCKKKEKKTSVPLSMVLRDDDVGRRFGDFVEKKNTHTDTDGDTQNEIDCKKNKQTKRDASLAPPPSPLLYFSFRIDRGNCCAVLPNYYYYLIFTNFSLNVH